MHVEHYPFQTKPLPYAYDALEPAISCRTMKLHYETLYKGYVDRLNKLVCENRRYSGWSVYRFLYERRRLPCALCGSILYNAGGMYNHELFFSSLTPEVCTVPDGISCRLIRCFGSVAASERAFVSAAAELKGSGYITLVCDRAGRLKIICVKNQDIGYTREYAPLIALDVWEHAYLFDRGADRAAYIKAVFPHINWAKAEMRLNRLGK